MDMICKLLFRIYLFIILIIFMMFMLKKMYLCKKIRNEFNRNNMSKQEKLFEEFPPITTEKWESVIEKDLKGADYDKKLVWKAAEGFNVKPYYRSEDLESATWTDALPGEFPYIRGNKEKGNNWLVCQDIIVTDYASANKKALEAISRGAEAISFKLEYDKLYDTVEIYGLLKGIDA